MSEPKEFRFSSKRYLLTYSQINPLMTKEFFLDTLKRKGNLLYYSIGLENHKDGGKHIHAYVYYSKPIRSRDPKYLDVLNYHPNAQPIKSDEHMQNAISYTQKEGDFIADVRPVLDMSNPINYVRRKRDYQEWIQDTTDSKHVVQTDHKKIKIGNFDHEFKGKQGNLIVFGDPNMRKTTIIHGSYDDDEVWHPGVLDPKDCYVIRDFKHPFEKWSGQRYIIYDDPVVIDWDMVKQLGEQRPVAVGFPGVQRYNAVMIPAHMKLYVIIILNTDRWYKEKERIPQGIFTRFNVYNVV